MKERYIFLVVLIFCEFLIVALLKSAGILIPNPIVNSTLTVLFVLPIIFLLLSLSRDAQIKSTW